MPNMKSFPRKTLETIAKEPTPRGKAAREELAKMGVDKEVVKGDTKKPVQKRTRKTTTKTDKEDNK